MRVSGLGLGILAGLVLFLGAATCPAQMQWGLYAEGSGASLRVSNTNAVYGSTFGFYVQKDGGKANFGADFRGAMLGGGNTQGTYTDERLDYGLFGARVATHPLLNHLMPYVEGLVGMGYFREGQGVTRQNATSGSLHAVGGVDVKIRGRLEWRAVEVDYGRVRGQLYSVHPLAVSSGIVFHIQ